MKKVTMKKSSKAGKRVNRFSSSDVQEMLVLGSALGESMMGILSQVATSRRGVGAAECTGHGLGNPEGYRNV